MEGSISSQGCERGSKAGEGRGGEEKARLVRSPAVTTLRRLRQAEFRESLDFMKPCLKTTQNSSLEAASTKAGASGRARQRTAGQ